MQNALFIDRRFARASRVHFTKDCLVAGSHGALWDCRSALLQYHRVLPWLVDQRHFFRLRPPQAMSSSEFDQSELKKMCGLTLFGFVHSYVDMFGDEGGGNSMKNEVISCMQCSLWFILILRPDQK